MKAWLLSLFFLSAAVNAQDFGDWILVTAVPKMPIVSTSSGSSEVGVFCLQGSATCHSYLVIEGLCDSEEMRIPILVNASTGAFPLVANCRKVRASWFLVLDDFEVTRAVFESGGEAGFAIPLASGQFRVIRFSMRGATRAIREVMRLGNSGVITSPSKTDQVL